MRAERSCILIDQGIALFINYSAHFHCPNPPAGSVSELKPLGKSTRRPLGVLCRAHIFDLSTAGIDWLPTQTCIPILNLRLRPVRTQRTRSRNNNPIVKSRRTGPPLSLNYRDRLAINYRDHAQSVSELKPLGKRGDDRRRSLPALLIAPTPPSFRLLEENGNGRLNRSGPSDPPGTMKTLEPGIRLSVTPPTGLLTARRRFQTKQRVQLLCNGVSKQNNASNYFETAFPSKTTRPITLKRRYQTKQRVQLLCNGVTKQNNASNYFATALLNKTTRAITLQRRY